MSLTDTVLADLMNDLAVLTPSGMAIEIHSPNDLTLTLSASDAHLWVMFTGEPETALRAAIAWLWSLPCNAEARDAGMGAVTVVGGVAS